MLSSDCKLLNQLWQYIADVAITNLNIGKLKNKCKTINILFNINLIYLLKTVWEQCLRHNLFRVKSSFEFLLQRVKEHFPKQYYLI